MSLDFKNKTFQKVFRGYSPDEVSEYLDYIEEEYDRMEKRAETAEKRLVFALRKLDEASKRLDEIALEEEERAAAADDVVAEAEYTSKRITAEAKLKAAKIIKGATDTAENILKQAEIDLAEATAKEEAIIRSTRKIYGEIERFRDSIFDLYKVHIEAIEMLSDEAGTFLAHVDENTFDAECDVIPDYVADGTEAEHVWEEKEIPEILPLEDNHEESDSTETASGFITLDFEGEEDLVAEEPIEYAEEPVDDGLDDDVIFIGDGFETVDGADFYEDAEVANEPAEEVEDVEEDGGEFTDLDDFFSDGGESDMSLTDEFDMIFSSSDSGRNVDEIRRQPTVGAEEVPKHGWFDKRKK